MKATTYFQTLEKHKMLGQITPIILTYNEEMNIKRTLSALTWAKQVIVIDSISSDNTESICADFNNVKFVQRPFDQHAKQWNFGLEQASVSEWVLALDADHVLSQELIAELASLQTNDEHNGYWATFDYFISGKRLTQSLYPPLISLFKAKHAHYIQDGHTQRVQVDGKIGQLNEKIIHDDRKPTKRWLNSQWKYALQEASKLKTQSCQA